MKKIFGLSIILGMICLGLVTGGQAQPIKVGIAMNLTGPASSWGQYHTKGHQDYFRYVNEVKGGVVGKKVELIIVDTGYKIPEALAAIRKFATIDKVDMTATWSTGEGLAVKPIVKEYKMPNINYSTGWEIMEPPIDYIYLPFGTYKLDVAAVLEYIHTIHKGKEAPKVGLLTWNNAFGRSIHAPSKENATRLNINIVAIEEFPPAAVDLTTELLRLKGKGAEYLFLQMGPSAYPMVFKSADRINYDPMFLGTWVSSDPDFFKLVKGLMRNRLRIQLMAGLPVDGTPGVKVFDELIKRYKSVDKFDTSYWEGVAVGMIMERAFQRSHEKFGKINSEVINMAMETFQNEDFGGIIPPVSYSKTNHEGSFMGRIVQVNEDGTYTPLTNFFVPGKDKVQVLKGK